MKKLYFLAIVFLFSQNLFAGEFFVRVMRNGYMTATFGDQIQSNSTAIFRFFELPGGTTWLRIQDQYGNQLYNGSHFVGVNQRVIAEINQNGNLIILQTENCGPQWNYGGGYGGNNNGYPNPGFPNPGNNNGGSYDQNAFNQFLLTLEKESFDSNKLTTAKTYADKTQLSAQQVADIAKKFSFDSNRLEWAKYAYNKCFDKANYFLLKSTFTYTSSYRDLETYMNGN